MITTTNFYNFRLVNFSNKCTIIYLMSKKEAINRYGSDEQDFQASESKRQKKKQNHPRFIKNRITDVDSQEIVVNLSKTHYDVIEIVVEELGWIVQRSKKSQIWDIMWTDYHIEAQDLFKLNDHQKISHFPAIYVLAKKNFLGRSLMKMSKYFPNDYNFFPQTWSVPSELGELLRFNSQKLQDQNNIYIYKPQAASQGKGITLFSNIQQLQGKTGIVQTYVNNPYLIDGLKFDMRIYVLIYGCDPIRIYVYEEGLARFATQNYERAKKKNLKANYVHLTNYAINKNNKKFVFNTSEKHMNVGHKRSLTSIYNLLKSRGVDIATIKKKIDRLIVKTLLVGKPMLNHMYGLSQMDNLANDHCFHILGFDVLLDQNLQPILLQVNHTPSFATDTPLDKSIKKNLIKQTLLLLNVNVKTKKAKIDKKREYEEKRTMRKLTKLTPQQKYELKKIIEKQKNQHEAVTLKRYRRLYPVETNQFSQIEEMSQKIFNEQCGFKNKQAKDTRIVSTPVKKTMKIRPQSFQQMQINRAQKKIRAQGTVSSLMSPKTNILDYIDQKLPDISPKKMTSLRSSTISPKRLMKTYQFNPEKVFAQFQDKIYHHRIYISHRLQDGQPFSQQKLQKNPEQQIKQQEQIIESKLLRLTSLATKNIILFGNKNGEKAPVVEQSKKQVPRNFADFVSYSNRQPVIKVIHNKRAPTIIKTREQGKCDSSLMQKKQFIEQLQFDQQLMVKSALVNGPKYI